MAGPWEDFAPPAATPARALAYGPVVGEYGRSQMVGAYNNPLGPQDVALSPNLIGQYPLGSNIDAVDQEGNPIGSYRVADTSWYHPGYPTRDTIEFRDRDISNQQVNILPSRPPWEDFAPRGEQVMADVAKQPLGQKASVFEHFRQLAATPSPEWLQPAEERARAFVEGAGVPGSLQQAKEFVTKSPIEDIKDIYSGITQIPERVRNIGETLSTSPVATVARAPLSPEAFGVYGTTAGLLLPAAQKAFKTQISTPELGAKTIPQENLPNTPEPISQPNVPEGYARFQPPSEITTQPEVPQIQSEQDLLRQAQLEDRLPNQVAAVGDEIPVLSQPNVPDEGYARFQPPSEITTTQPEVPQIQSEQDLIKQAQLQGRLPNQVAAVGEEIPVLSQPEPTQTVAEMQGERIVETAYKYAGKIYPGGSIHKGFPEGIEEVPGASTPEYGFLTNTGRFVDREEAAQISKVATQTLTHDQIGQQPKETTPNASQITSTKGLPSGEVRPSVAQETPLRQPGETAPVQQQVGQEQVQQERAVGVPETPRTTGIAQRIHEQRGLGIEPGQGISAKAAVEQGRAAIGEADAVAARIKATGQVTAGDLGILRAKQEQFAKATNAAEDALRARPNDNALGKQYEQAFQQERDYAQNVVKPAQTIWHKLGMEQQGAVDIDTGSFTGLRRAVEELHKEPVRPEQAPRLEAAVQKVRKAVNAETKALQKLANATERGRRTKARTMEELRDHLAERMKQITPC